jgi:hypothetical protein
LALASSILCFKAFVFLISRLWLKFRNKYVLLGGVVSRTPNPQPGGQGHPFLSGSSPLTCLAWETLPVTTLPLV